MSDIEVFKPKTSPIDVLNNYKFTEDEIKKLECIYTKEWDLYVKGLTQFIDQSILDKVKGIKLCVSKITTGDPDKWIDTNEVFSEAKHQAFVKWLFKSHIMALRDCDRAIGNSIDHHLPILFRIYINEGRYKRLLSEDLPETAKIEDFNKLTKLVIDTLNEVIGPYFELDVVSGVTTEDRFQYIPVNVKMKTIYQESEDAYIKSFLAHLVAERNKQTGLEEFHPMYNHEKSSEGLLSVFLIGTFLMPIVVSCIVSLVMKFSKSKYDSQYKRLLKKLSKEDAKKVDAIIKEVSTYVGNFIKNIDEVCEEIFKDNNVFAVYNGLNHMKPVRIKQKYAKYANIVDSDEYRNSVEKNMSEFVEKLLKFAIIGKPLKLDSDTKIIRVECTDNGYVLTENVANKLDKIFDKVFKCSKGIAKTTICERPAELHYKTVIYDNDSTLFSSIALKDPSNGTGHEDLYRSEELFGFGKKKENSNNKEIDYTKLLGFKKEIFDKVHSLFRNSWNYKAYKLPTDIGDMSPKYKEDYDDESDINDRNSECGFEKNIKEEESFGYTIKVKGDKLVIHGEGIYSFAWGQPTEFPIYNKTLDDISARWNRRLTEKQSVVKEFLSKYYKNISISTNVDIGDGDEGCVYPEYTITVPIEELRKPIKKSKEELLKLCETGTKILIKAFQKNGNPKGFTYRSKDEINEQIHDYLTDNDGSSITIGDIDAWEFTNGKARDQAEYEKYNNVLINIENDIKRLMKQMNYPCNITSDGSDWDDGCYWINFNEQPDFKELKNYMS